MSNRWHFFILWLVLSSCFLPPPSLFTQESDQKKSLYLENAVLFTGNANNALAQEISTYLNMPLGKATVKRFNDGEIQIGIEQTVRNKDIFIIQPTCPSEKQSVNDNLMELYLLIRTMKRSSAASITAIIPYYGYARQDRKTNKIESISAADVAMLLEQAGVNRVVTVDLHCGQIQGFFQNVPVDNLYASRVFIPYYIKKGLQNVVVVSPDAGGVDRANKFLAGLAEHGVIGRLAIISKQRACAGVIESMNLLGDVTDANAIIVDDMCDTGGTLCKAAQLLKDHGAKKVFAAISHPVFSGSALEKIRCSVIEEMVITNSIPLKQTIPSNIQCISIAPLLGNVIAAYAMKNQVTLSLHVPDDNFEF